MKKIVLSGYASISIERLIVDKKYSPMFKKTFDLLSNEEMKEQLDYWVENNYKTIEKYDELAFRGKSQKQLYRDYLKKVIK